MLRFKVRKSANIIDKEWGSGQIWVSFPDDIKYLWDKVALDRDEIRTLRWRLGWNDEWETVQGYWNPIERLCYVDDIMKFQENQSVMFFIPD